MNYKGINEMSVSVINKIKANPILDDVVSEVFGEDYVENVEDHEVIVDWLEDIASEGTGDLEVNQDLFLMFFKNNKKAVLDHFVKMVRDGQWDEEMDEVIASITDCVVQDLIRELV